MRRSAPTVLLAVALALPASGARADDAAVPEARTLFKQGVRLYSAGDYERARVKFAAAHALVKSEDVVWNLALAEAKSGHAADAMNHLHAYVRAPKARAADVKEARAKWIPMLEPEVAELDVTGTEGTTVSIDGGDPVGVLPLADPWAVKAGHHRVAGKLGSDVVAREVDAAKGQTIAVSLVVAQPAPEPVVAPVAVAPAPTPAAPPPPEPAPAPVTTSTSAPVDTSTGAPDEDLGPRRRSNAARTWLTIGLGAGAVVAAGAGVYFGVQSSNDASDARALTGSSLANNACRVPTNAGCSTLSDDVHGANTDHTVSIVMYAGAGALAAGALAAFLFMPKTVERSAFVPAVGAGQVGGVWVTEF